jgi:hypothetical protein
MDIHSTHKILGYDLNGHFPYSAFLVGKPWKGVVVAESFRRRVAWRPAPAVRC